MKHAVLKIFIAVMLQIIISNGIQDSTYVINTYSNPTPVEEKGKVSSNNITEPETFPIYVNDTSYSYATPMADNGEFSNTAEPETYDLVNHFSYEDVDLNYYDADDEDNRVESGTDDPLDVFLKDACYRQTCRQVITGRNLNYLRALHILQSEEYITGLTGEKAQIIEVDSSPGRTKRQITGTGLSDFYTDVQMNYQAYCLYINGTSEIQFKYFSYNIASRICAAYFDTCVGKPSCPPFQTPSLEALRRCEFKPNCLRAEDYLSIATTEACIATGTVHLLEITKYFCSFLFLTPPPAYQKADSILAATPALVGIVGVAGMLGLLMTKDLPAVGKKRNPPGSPPPGTPLGGGLPSKTTSTSIFARSLVPIDHPTIAVFPPFSKPRSLRAIGVIFKEDVDMELADIMMEQAQSSREIKKRSAQRFKRSGIRTHYRRPSILTPIFYAFNLIRKKHKYVNHQIDIFKGHAECFRANLKMIIREIKKKTDPKPKTTTTQAPTKSTTTTSSTTTASFYSSGFVPSDQSSYLSFNPYQDSLLRPRRRKRSFQRVVAKSFEDCMYLKRPALYGFRVSVVLSENEPCELGVSCKGDLIIRGGSELPASVNTTFYPAYGLEFEAEGPETCEVMLLKGDECN